MWNRKELCGKAKAASCEMDLLGQVWEYRGRRLSRGLNFISEVVSLSLQTHLPVRRSPALSNVPGGNSQKSRDNKSISYATSFSAFNFWEYFC